MHPITLPAHHRTTLLAAALPIAGWAAHTTVYRRRLNRARRDPLTGLHTREGFLTQAEQIATRPNAVVVFIDLDHFKQANDQHGHRAGDAVLFATAHTLERWTGRAGVVARIGGDEFAAILTLPPDRLAERLDALTSALHQPLTWEGQRIPRGASIGAVRLADLPEPTVSAALGAADTAMYAAKRGLSGWQLHTPATDLTTSPRRWRRNRPAAR
ncbi:GGDEF domain-containing protein [Kitasatospora sp. NPDC052896]|uniref:GGDEF domain-containing protein n=1 Tax=Kitasatospora sp. NPDC052896 TaxID=3364061 RepID=UPI0037C69C2D